MKRALLFVFCAFSVLRIYAQQNAFAQQVLEWVRTSNGDSLVSKFHPAIRATLPATAINQIWSQLEERAGIFLQQSAWDEERRDTLTIEHCQLKFEKDDVHFSLLTDDNHYIVGFHFKPVSQAIVNPTDKKVNRDYLERDTFLLNGRIKLPGTLCFPINHSDKCPVVVIVHGLGPIDQDGTLGPNKPYRDVAHEFASKGIASLRYDKRTYVYGSRSCEISGSLTYDTEVVDDAIRALEMVAHLSSIDPSKIFIMGHSLGGMLAPRIAMLSDIPVAGLISIAASTHYLEDWLREQFRYLAQLEGTSVDQADSLTQVIYSKMPASYRSFASQYNPVGTARGLTLPMLFMQGGHDFQVTANDFERWKRGLNGQPNVRFLWFDNCDNLMRETPKMAEPEIYMRPGQVTEAAIDAMVKFVQGD